jgi:DNA-binding transcriptional LysR family regulator
MELRHLRYFSVLAKELNFRRAAERLHVSHPALSKQFKDLEMELGVKLIERNTVHSSLTKAGRTFLAEANSILKKVEHATGRLRTASEAEGRLIIGNPGPFSSAFMPVMLKRFRKMHPRANIDFVQYSPRKQIARLLAGEQHISISMDRELPADNSLTKGLIVSSGFGIAVARSHRLASARRLSLTQLAGEKFYCLMWGRHSPHRAEIKRVFKAGGVRTPPLIKVEDFGALLTLISGEQGISLLPMMFARSCPKDLRLIPLAKEFDSIEFSLWAIWRTHDRSPLVRDFAQSLQASQSQGRTGVPKPRTALSGAKNQKPR